MNDRQARMVVRAGMLQQFMEAEIQAGETERSIARRAQLSHTTVQRLRSAREGVTVNILTARKMERALGIPRSTIFLPAVLPDTGHTAQVLSA